MPYFNLWVPPSLRPTHLYELCFQCHSVFTFFDFWILIFVHKLFVCCFLLFTKYIGKRVDVSLSSPIFTSCDQSKCSMKWFFIFMACYIVNIHKSYICIFKECVFSNAEYKVLYVLPITSRLIMAFYENSVFFLNNIC